MVIGIGNDLVSVARVRELMKDWDQRFLEKVFTDLEIAYCQAKPEPALHFASRFAAKESVLKALGTGFSEGIRMKDVEITSDKLGKPLVQLHGKAKEIANKKQAKHIHLSLSDEKEYAMATVVIES